MNADKQKFYDVAMKMQTNSSILFEHNCNDSNHGSVYLAGYVLEVCYYPEFRLSNKKPLLDINERLKR